MSTNDVRVWKECDVANKRLHSSNMLLRALSHFQIAVSTSLIGSHDEPMTLPPRLIRYEVRLSNITRRKIPRGVFKSVVDLEDAIKRLHQGAQQKFQAVRLDRTGRRDL